VHRSARARELLGLPPEARVSEAVLLQLLQHKDGCLKGIPTASRKLALINQADSAAEMAAAQVLGGKLQRLNFARVVITSYANAEPIIRGIAD
jgi:probable selenium-dependent hydroxylase accessory protein YqeC